MLISSAVSSQTIEKKPNIIFILTDDQGYGDFASTGNSYLKTPNMDKLRSSGVFFDNFHVSAVSAPTRAALMTGRYAYRTGVTGTNASRVNMFADEKTVAEYLKEAGYNTANFGKWHLGYNYPMRPIDQGFDEYYMWEEMQFFRTDPIMEENGENVQYKGRFLTDVIFEKSINYIERISKNKNPFFIYLATYLPHTHHDGKQVPDEYMDRFNKYTELSWHTRQTYAMIEKVDEQLGLLLDKINELGLGDNTIIVFGSDNGPATWFPGQFKQTSLRYRAGFRGVKGDVYEGGIRTPFFFVWKNKFKVGTTQSRFSAHVDLLPTLLDFAGVKPNSDKVLDGNSLYPLLMQTNETIPQTRYFYHARPEDMNILKNEWKLSCYIENDFKLVNGEELYNLKCDPYELTDLASSKPELMISMREKCSKFIREQLDERKLKYPPNIIGSDNQEIVNLYYAEPTLVEKGWPVRVIKKGKYKLTIYDIQLEEIAERATFVVKAKDKLWKLPVDKSETYLEFNNLELPIGEYFLHVNIEGDSFPKSFENYTDKQGRFRMREKGHRLITVQPQKLKGKAVMPATIKLYDGLID